MRRNYSRTGRPRRRQRGFTLIESMVALLVLSIGLIGIAAMNGQGLAASRTAVSRTVAITLAADMADRIRANRSAGMAYNGPEADNGCTGNTDCSPDELAAYDLFLWTDQVEEGANGVGLADGVGTVVADDTTDPMTYTITVQWNEPGAGQLTHTTSIQVPQF